MSQAQTQVSTTNHRSQVAINIANYLRENKILKRRTGLLNNTDDVEFFRFKRLTRALLSEEYKSKQKSPNGGLVPVASTEDANKIFVMLVQSQFIIPVEKLHHSDFKKHKSWKPNRTKPTLKPITQASMTPDAYYVWTYNKPNPFILLYSILVIAGVFAIILFPLWPNFMKIGVWYLSVGALCLIGLFFLIAIIRLIICLITLLACPRAFWLFPNLFEDCGVIESFQPTYAWETPKASKSKKGKNKEQESRPTSGDGAVATGSSTTATAPVRRKVVLEEVDD